METEKSIYTKKHLIQIGGPTEGLDAEDSERKTDQALVLITFHGMPSVWHSELFHTFL